MQHKQLSHNQRYWWRFWVFTIANAQQDRPDAIAFETANKNGSTTSDTCKCEFKHKTHKQVQIMAKKYDTSEDTFQH